MNIIRWYEDWVRAAIAGAAALIIAWSGAASAQGFSVTIEVDENCNGTFTNTSGFFSPLPCALLPDPGPSGFPAAVTYGLLNPPGLTAGDLVLVEPGDGLSDQIRFNPQQNGGSLVFYSDNLDGDHALADMGDTGGAYDNLLILDEVGLEDGANGFTYTPTAGQPGFVAGAGGPVTYIIHSDSVPEPATLALLALGLAGLGFSRRRELN